MTSQNQTWNLLLLNINNDWIETWLKSKYIAIVININNEMPKWNIKFIPIQNKSVIVHVCFVLFIVCLHICVCECLLQNFNHKIKYQNKTNCGSAFGPPKDASGRSGSARPEDTPAMDLGQMNVVLKWVMCMKRCMCMFVVDWGFVIISFICFPFFSPPFYFCFFEFIKCVKKERKKCVCGLRWMCCGGDIACCVECTNVVKRWLLVRDWLW